MKKIFFLACLYASPIQAETLAERHYVDAMAALNKCENTWFQSSREKALKTIDNTGAYLAITLDPFSKEYDSHAQMLEEVTSALQRCSMLVGQENYEN